MWAFLKPTLQWAQQRDEYADVLARVRAGAPTENMYASGR